MRTISVLSFPQVLSYHFFSFHFGLFRIFPIVYRGVSSLLFHAYYDSFSIYLMIVSKGGEVIFYFPLFLFPVYFYVILSTFLAPASLSSPPSSPLSIIPSTPSSSSTLYLLEQHYLIIDRMILPSTRMAWHAEHTFEFVNVHS